MNRVNSTITKTAKAALNWLGLLFVVFTVQSGWAEYEEIIYYHNDALGSPVMATDASGNVKWEEDYMPFGKRLEYQSQELVNGEPQEDAWDETAWYTGHQEEPRLGLVYMGARWYDPSIGRFLGMDPAGVREHVASNPMMFNRYAYANNNPYRYIDPDGRCSKELSSSATLCGIADAIANTIEPVIESAMEAVGIDVIPEGQRDPEGEFSHTASDNSLAVEAVAIGTAIVAASNPVKKLSKIKKSVKKEKIGDKFTKTTKIIPGRGPGQSRSEMEFVKNSEGKVIRSRKFSYDRGNKFQHKKPARGGPEGRPANEDQ